MHGILLVEVKGGGISYLGSQQQWISRDHGGNEYRINPFAQVVQCKYALLNKIKSLPGWTPRWITIGHAVAFPDCTIEHITLPPDAPPDIIIDGRHLLHLPESIEEIMRYWSNQGHSSSPIGAELIQDLERLLAPTITLPNPLAIQLADIVELDEELPATQVTRDALCYVAFSRPRNHLIVLGKKEILRELLPHTI